MPRAKPPTTTGGTTPLPYPMPAPRPLPPGPPPDDERVQLPSAGKLKAGAGPTIRYARATPPIATTITRPGPCKTTIRIEGRILGTTYRGRDVHHYRVAGNDGVLYLCPPEWLPAEPLGLEPERPEDSAFRHLLIALVYANRAARRVDA